MNLSITHYRPRSILKNTHLCNTCLSPRQRLPFPQTPHDEIFLRSRHVRMQHTHQFPATSCPQGFPFHQATNKQHSGIQSRMHLHDTVSAPVANRTLNICPEHFFIVNISKLASLTNGETNMRYFTQGIHLSFFFLFSFSFDHSIITIIIITEHGALLTGHGSWMASSVNVVTPSATPPNIAKPM